jgi:dTDP-D-glucose 4,6-dehydratase
MSIDIHVGANNSIGGRKWFYAGDVADHTEFVLASQETKCEKWNSAGTRFISNLEFAEIIADQLGKELSINYIPIDRPGHDLYFSGTANKLYEQGFVSTLSTEDKLRRTVDWYKNNQNWL